MVRVFDPEGAPLFTLGTPGVGSGFLSGTPFERCTHSAVAPDGTIYVADGYGKARVHKFAPDGRHVDSWGTPGSGPGQFVIPHNITCDGEGNVYVADRENHRVQVFDPNGGLLYMWSSYRAQGLYVSRTEDLVIVGNVPGRGVAGGGHRVSR